MRRLLLLTLFLVPTLARASYTETVPKGVFFLDERLAFSKIEQHWNNEGELGPLLEPIERYEPGGGLQGVLIPEASARYTLLISILAFGITEDLTAMVGLPVALKSVVEPRLGWEPGDYNATLGRPYSEDDFWEWAGSMGQPKPQHWEGNKGVPSDLVLGLRWRFTDNIDLLDDLEIAMAIAGFATIPTGTPPDPEEIVSVGTTGWNLHAQGDAGLHFGIDKHFKKALDGRLVLGVDFFYEPFWPRTRKAPTGASNPLLLNKAPYVGETYRLDPGDFYGADFGIDVIAIRGPTWNTWLSRSVPEASATFPPLLSFNFRYKFIGIGQSNWESESAIWDWEQERFWAPGYKNILFAQAMVSGFRLGVPLRAYVTWRSISVLPGKNARAVDVIFAGIQLPLKFW